MQVTTDRHKPEKKW